MHSASLLFRSLRSPRQNLASLWHRRLATIVVVATVFAAIAPQAEVVEFTTSTVIEAGDTTHDTKDITVTNCTLTVQGYHAFGLF